MLLNTYWSSRYESINRFCFGTPCSLKLSSRESIMLPNDVWVDNIGNISGDKLFAGDFVADKSLLTPR